LRYSESVRPSHAQFIVDDCEFASISRGLRESGRSGVKIWRSADDRPQHHIRHNPDPLRPGDAGGFVVGVACLEGHRERHVVVAPIGALRRAPVRESARGAEADAADAPRAARPRREVGLVLLDLLDDLGPQLVRDLVQPRKGQRVIDLRLAERQPFAARPPRALVQISGSLQQGIAKEKGLGVEAPNP
jgi:hypothetical protein